MRRLSVSAVTLAAGIILGAELGWAADSNPAAARRLIWMGATVSEWRLGVTNWSGEANWNNEPPDHAIFGGASGGRVTIIPTIHAASVRVTNGYYLFTGGPLTVTGDLGVQGANTWGGAGSGTLALSNGIFTANRIVAAGDWGTVALGSNAVVTATEGVDGSANGAATFSLNLDGGELHTPSIVVADFDVNWGRAFLTFNGTRVCATADQLDFLRTFAHPATGGLNDHSARIAPGGAWLDTGTHELGIQLTLRDAATGSGPLVKLGSGRLTLSAANTWSGETIVQAGRLVLGQAGSVAKSPVLHVAAGAVLDVSPVPGGFTLEAGQTLRGSGTVEGTLTLRGLLAPGEAALGTLTFRDALTLAGTARFRLGKSGGVLTQDQVLASGSLAAGGVFEGVWLPGPEPMAAGDCFTPFGAARFSGQFENIILPSPGSALRWDLEQFKSKGALEVVRFTAGDAPTEAPPNLTASLNGQRRVTLEWSEMPGIIAYRVVRNGQLMADVTRPKYSEAELTPGSNYVYSVQAITAAGLSPATAPVYVYVPAVTSAGKPEANQGVLGDWIWADRTFDSQTCRFWRMFEIPPAARVTKALLQISADNEFTFFLDGRELARGADWLDMYQLDLSTTLAPGRHVLAVQAFNSARDAGLICGLAIQLADGQRIEVKSDPTWRVVPSDVRRWEGRREAKATWPAARVVGLRGNSPWAEFPRNTMATIHIEPVRITFTQTLWFQLTLVSLSGLALLVFVWLLIRLGVHRREVQMIRRERGRIARDIHDDIGARISQLVLDGEVAKSELRGGTEAHDCLARICEEGREVLSAMDEVLWAVSPQRDTLPAFTSFVCDYADDIFRASATQCFLDVEPMNAEMVFDFEQRRGLMLAVKEALRNVRQHAEASEVSLRIFRARRSLVVVVRDNGKGFDPTRADPERNGLVNMTARMRELGGTCRLESRPGAGCQIEFRVPLKAQRWRSWFFNRRPTGGAAPEKPIDPL